MSASPDNIREIPYNYTSFSDREIVIRFLGENIWEALNRLRGQRKTGNSARLLFDILGDMWVIRRNPYIQDDLINNPPRLSELNQNLNRKLKIIESRAQNNPDTLELVDASKQAIADFNSWLGGLKKFRNRLLDKLKPHTNRKNICFDGLSRVSHVTDASDWRVEYPAAVITPDTEIEVINLVKACLKLDLNIIVRGGGTGYTGAASPLTDRSVVINTEKLDFVGEVSAIKLEGHEFSTPTISAGAGAVTRSLSDMANSQNLVFAVDPTSQDSSTVGGNIAMNAGGKKALMWGTALDNLAVWRMVMPDGKLYEISRVNHNLGKIHDVEKAVFNIRKADSKKIINTVCLKAEDARKPGLGKDVTNKLLGFLPGVQKEGCDGIITAATFILHRPFKFTHTLCLEFFHPDMPQNVEAITKITAMVKQTGKVFLTGLEHLDHRYIRAVGYSAKSSRSQLPWMLLLADLGGDNEQDLDKMTAKITGFCRSFDAEGFVATTKESRDSFWSDRAKTAAIAAHTNAFKINEDVVIPLENLSKYANGIERINRREENYNRMETINSFKQIIRRRRHELDRDNEVDHIHLDKLNSADLLLENFLKTTSNKFSLKQDVLAVLYEIFNGDTWRDIREEFDLAYRMTRRRRLLVATHMHAGDGNVHTNIPVHSNDYVMLQRADKIVDEIMELALSCNGVISGEHGIGITKLKYLHPENIADFEKYNREVDPKDNFNRGKLRAGADLSNAYTPSLRLLEMEALLLEESELGKLNAQIKDCLRCGKCKPVCSTHVPRSRLLYSPRNKILATGLLIEAFLYEEQTKRGISREHFNELNDIAEHCTSCHRCLAPCPVNIDFGDITANIRHILSRQGKLPLRPGQTLSMAFLNSVNSRAVNAMRTLLISLGFRLQAQAAKLIKNTKSIPLTNKNAGISQQVVSFLKYPLPNKNIPATALRSMLAIESNEYVPLIAKKSKRKQQAVFYFPGCGSEKLFSNIGLAVLKWLYESDVITVLPSSYMCCGYPQLAAGLNRLGNKIITENRVLLHRLAKAVSYLKVSKIIVSCGTCLDQLITYELDKLFPRAELVDIHEYLLTKGWQVESGADYIFHDPCHSPLQRFAPAGTAAKLLTAEIKLSERCCGESGTFALARPDIASQVKLRKIEEINRDQSAINAAKILTACPSCLQGLNRLTGNTGLQADYVITEMTKFKFGPQWADDFVSELADENAIERVLL